MTLNSIAALRNFEHLHKFSSTIIIRPVALTSHTEAHGARFVDDEDSCSSVDDFPEDLVVGGSESWTVMWTWEKWPWWSSTWTCSFWTTKMIWCQSETGAHFTSRRSHWHWCQSVRSSDISCWHEKLSETTCWSGLIGQKDQRGFISSRVTGHRAPECRAKLMRKQGDLTSSSDQMIHGILITYVDDILIAYPQCHIDLIIKLLLAQYVMKCYGSLLPGQLSPNLGMLMASWGATK